MACGSVIAGLFVVAASGGEVRLAERAPAFDVDLEPPPPVATAPPPPDGAVDREEGATSNGRVDVPDVLSGAMQVVLVATGAAIVWMAWRRRPVLRRKRPARALDVDLDVDVLTSLTDAAAGHRRLLSEGEPRNAIVACWVRLEELVATSGIPRHPADTSAEFTARVLAGLSVDGAAVERMAALYREARFSSHPIGEDRRAEAIALLDAIHAGLGATGVRVP